MRVRRGIGALLAMAAVPAAAHADYLVLRSGARVNVSAYELRGEKYRIQVDGGWASKTFSIRRKMSRRERAICAIC